MIRYWTIGVGVISRYWKKVGTEGVVGNEWVESLGWGGGVEMEVGRDAGWASRIKTTHIG